MGKAVNAGSMARKGGVTSKAMSEKSILGRGVKIGPFLAEFKMGKKPGSQGLEEGAVMGGE